MSSQPDRDNSSNGLKIFLEILNIVSSICGVVGISLLWLKESLNFSGKNIIVLGLIFLIGCTLVTAVTSAAYYLYNEYGLSIRKINQPFLIMLYFCVLACILLPYYIFCKEILFDFFTNLI